MSLNTHVNLPASNPNIFLLRRSRTGFRKKKQNLCAVGNNNKSINKTFG